MGLLLVPKKSRANFAPSPRAELALRPLAVRAPSRARPRAPSEHAFAIDFDFIDSCPFAATASWSGACNPQTRLAPSRTDAAPALVKTLESGIAPRAAGTVHSRRAATTRASARASGIAAASQRSKKMPRHASMERKKSS